MVMGMIGFDMALSVLLTDIIQNNQSCFNDFLKRKYTSSKQFKLQSLTIEEKGEKIKWKKRPQAVGL